MTPSLEGTYRLTKWEALDDKQEAPPVQQGTLTFTRTHRIFTFVGRDKDGKLSSEMYVAKCELSESTYTETPEYLVLDYHHGERPASYDLNNETVASRVPRTNGQLAFVLPHPFETVYPVTVTFEPKVMKATVGGQFIYYWEKVA